MRASESIQAFGAEVCVKGIGGGHVIAGHGGDGWRVQSLTISAK
ncbi:hypothetical protein E3A20_26390, partial [Planctomyces bekefii]